MVILWVNIRVRPPPSWNSVFGTTWLRFSSRSRFRARVRNLVGPGPVYKYCKHVAIHSNAKSFDFKIVSEMPTLRSPWRHSRTAKLFVDTVLLHSRFTSAAQAAVSASRILLAVLFLGFWGEFSGASGSIFPFPGAFSRSSLFFCCSIKFCGTFGCACRPMLLTFKPGWFGLFTPKFCLTRAPGCSGWILRSAGLMLRSNILPSRIKSWFRCRLSDNFLSIMLSPWPKFTFWATQNININSNSTKTRPTRRTAAILRHQSGTIFLYHYAVYNFHFSFLRDRSNSGQ